MAPPPTAGSSGRSGCAHRAVLHDARAARSPDHRGAASAIRRAPRAAAPRHQGPSGARPATGEIQQRLYARSDAELRGLVEALTAEAREHAAVRKREAPLPSLSLREIALEPGVRLIVEEGWRPRDPAALEAKIRAALAAWEVSDDGGNPDGGHSFRRNPDPWVPEGEGAAASARERSAASAGRRSRRGSHGRAEVGNPFHRDRDFRDAIDDPRSAAERSRAEAAAPSPSGTQGSGLRRKGMSTIGNCHRHRSPPRAARAARIFASSAAGSRGRQPSSTDQPDSRLQRDLAQAQRGQRRFPLPDRRVFPGPSAVNAFDQPSQLRIAAGVEPLLDFRQWQVERLRALRWRGAAARGARRIALAAPRWSGDSSSPSVV